MMGHQNPYLPPGCTDADVDRAMGGTDPNECTHTRLSGPCPRCGEAATCLTCGVELCPCSDRRPAQASTLRPAADPWTEVAAALGPGGPFPKRNLTDDPALADIYARIGTLERMRGQFTDASRERWSILNDLHRELSALMRVVQRATGRRS